MATGAFKHFDYGYVGNWQRYGQLTPPWVDIKKIRVPVVLIQGALDVCGDTDDNEIVAANLKKAGVLAAQYVFKGEDHLSLVSSTDMSFFDEIQRFLTTWQNNIEERANLVTGETFLL